VNPWSWLVNDFAGRRRAGCLSERPSEGESPPRVEASRSVRASILLAFE
jgi:hypothetical protein